jgi:uncharacterized protein (TIGR03032 family)
MASNPTPEPVGPEGSFRSAHTPGFAGLLESLGITLLVTTYQAGKLMAVRAREGKINTLLRSFERPMGLAVRAPWLLALGVRTQIWLLRNAPDIAAQLPPAGTHDACFIPRVSYVTGDIRCHEMAWVGEELWIVNTFFSCLCTVHADYSFVPRWHPPFLPGPTPGDHCHLNGLAVAQGQARYVTALGDSTTPQGWRPAKSTGGIVLDIASGSVVSRGLSMPHSPRIHDGRLWVLDSGTGQLQIVDLTSSKRAVVAAVPGFARGLAFFGHYAFVGLSKIRESGMFGDLPVKDKDPQCGIWVIDLRSGQVVEFMQFQAGVEEIFAVEILADLTFPEILGFQQETLQGVFVTPRTPDGR